MLTVTLDTMTIIDPAKSALLMRIRQLAEEGKISIAVTTRVVADKDQDKNEDRKLRHLKEFESYHVVGTAGRWGMSRWDSGDMWA